MGVVGTKTADDAAWARGVEDAIARLRGYADTLSSVYPPESLPLRTIETGIGWLRELLEEGPNHQG